MKKFKTSVIKLFTHKLIVAISFSTIIFILYSIYNISENLTSDPNKQKFFSNFVLSTIIYLTVITLLLIAKLVIERVKQVSGSKLRFKLTLLFIFISLFPAIILSTSSNYLINEAMKRTNPGTGLIKPLEKSLRYYRNTLSINISNQIKANLKKSAKIPFRYFKANPKIFTLNETDIGIIFKANKNNVQIIKKVNNANLEKKETNFFTEYFDGNELEQPIIHMISKTKWIIFTIKKLYTRENVFILLGEVLGKNKIAVAEGIKAILDKYNRIQLISGSLIRDFNFFILLITLPVVLIAVILGFYLASAFTKPLNSLIDGTKKISQGIYGYTIEAKGGDELAQLITAFNLMSNELFANRNRLFEAEKLSAWREVAKKLAHEVKNPLTPIKLASERMQRSYYKDKDKFENVLKMCSTTISDEVDRLKNLVNEFSNFARFPQTNFSLENIEELIKNFLELYKEANVKITINFKSTLKKHEKQIRLDKNQLKQVIINLIDNAIEGEATIINVKTAEISKNNKRYLQISFSDNGSGIPDKYHDSLFEPHFTSKKRGTGLGLSIVKNIIYEHKGILYFKTEINQGTTFFIEIPYKWREDAI